MTIHLKSTAQVAKTFAIKREKAPDDSEVVIAHLKISDVLIDRDQLVVLCAQPIGWSQTALFDELGAPLLHATLELHRVEWRLSGVIRGGDTKASPRLTLKGADVTALTLELTKHGALMACALSWQAAGDEVDDVADLLGKTCAIECVLTDGGQGDLLGRRAA